ncbi:SusC/RagA family TonB-linked outer membrane protein [Flavobacterium sp. SM15]|uniref:SusC/RagA family TonB-linked outer membrane protein n=1 Tax=Flavobacterium sp. SM15 TaxID=2908005 RepID=UPI001ED9E7CA|nr:SusC/RagA family TonB-linked outer membrane protein [Flavobacterium sp. SM15]MCG2611350.1 SusC/RagA family TonB-linked outer membrane protein [Flavobacterium sp. SM15]
MRTKFKAFLTLAIVLLSQVIFAQERTVSGKVTDQGGLPLPGVSITEKGTKNGTQSDMDGVYTIKVKENATLVFSFIGMKSQEMKASSNSVNVKMVDEAKALEGVVVTALGIKREKKALGYSSQKVDGAAINQTPTNNFLNNLSGKVAGLEVKMNSNFGGSTNIVLRGIKSITGNNQALIVIDGVPVNNANLNTADAANARDGYDFGNSASDIDPNNIESVNVLKGAAATALYGSDAANGAIMITTKKGKKNKALGISINSTVSGGTIDRSTFAKYQKLYGGGGYDGHDNLLVQDVNGDGIDDLLVPTGYDISYGNAFNPNLMVYQWNAFVPTNPNYGQPTPWVGAKNDPSAFFQKSLGTVNSINFNGGDEHSTYNFNYTNNTENGVLPNSRLIKNTLTGNFTKEFGSRIKTGVQFNYSDQSTRGRNSVGYGDNFLGSFRQWWQTNVDVKELRDAYFQNKANVTWNMNDPVGGDLTPAYWNNPYWDRYENYETDGRKRLILGGNVSYDITKNFNVLGRATIETSNDRQEQRKAVGSHPEEFGISQIDESSGYQLFTRSFSQQTYDLIATYDINITNDLGLKLLGGGTLKHSKIDSFNGSTTGGLITPGNYNLANSRVYVAPVESELSFKKSGFYGQASFDYKKMLYLDGTFRQDKSTGIYTGHNVYNYTSIGGSFVFSEVIKPSWLNLGKLRLSYAEVGNDINTARAGAKVSNGLIDGNPMYSNSTTFFDYQKLKPETSKSWEVGIESSMFNNRASFEVSLYKTNTVDQIFNVPQSTSTGYSTSRINAGELQNKGVEVSLSGYPVKTKDFQWQINVNWAQNRNKLLSLDEGRSNLQLASFQSGITLNATVGQPYGTIRGTDYIYDDAGNKIVGADGNYLQTTTSDHVIGNIQAKWTGGVSNKVTYKNLSLNFLIDVKKGGSVFSLDQAYGQDTGLYPETAGLNDLGNPVRNTLADGGGFINPGVMLNPAFVPGNGQPQYIPNTIRVDASDSSEASGLGYGITANPDKAYVYDASFVKLREVGLTYSLPTKLLERTFISGASFGVSGNNLWIIDKNLPHADPEAGTSSGNVQGYQSGVMPTVKVYSFNVKLNF